ncbi:MAG: MFS transporter [Pseudomonadales bacterium]|nr:MFS transporter [Pseudomonadales bacterium]
MPDQTPATVEPMTAVRRLPHGFASLESVPFCWLIGSLLTFFLSMQGGFLIRSLLAWDLTHSELSLAYINLVIALPMVIGAFIAGAIIDRVERRRIVIVGQIVIILSEVLVLALMLMDLLQFWHLLATSFVMGIVYPFIMPTRTSMVMGLVGRERLGNAMALQTAAQNVARVMGPTLVGGLIPLISIEGAFITSISLYGVSTLGMLKLPRSFPNKSGRSLLKDVSYSFTYIGRHRPILLTVIFGILPLLLTLPVFSMLVVFTDQVWQTGEAGLGMLMAMIGLGGISGSMIVARMGDHQTRGRWMVGSALIFAVLLAAFSESPSFALALVLLLSANIFSNISITQNNTIIQLLVHEDVRGRMSSLMMLSLGLTPLGVLPIAMVSEIYGVEDTIFVGCLILLAIMMALYFLSPTLRNLDLELARKQAADEG